MRQRYQRNQRKSIYTLYTFLAVKTALYLGSSLTDTLTDSLTGGIQGSTGQSVITQSFFKLGPQILHDSAHWPPAKIGKKIQKGCGT